MSETSITKAILSWLREQGYYAIKVHGGPSQEAGVPDILACAPYRGLFVGIEVKVPGGKASLLQLHHITQIANAGGIAFVTDSLEDCRAQLALWEVDLDWR